MKKIKIFFVILIGIGMYFFSINKIAYSTENSQSMHGETAENQAHESEQGKNNTNHGTSGMHESPLEYYLIWSIIVLITILLFGYYMKFISVKGIFGSRIADDDLEHEQDIETIGFAFLIVLLAVCFYTILMMPELFGYFDSKAHSFVDGYHESNTNAFLRFVLVTLTGIMMTVYAFLGRHNH